MIRASSTAVRWVGTPSRGDEIEARESARGLEVSVTLDRVSHLRTITLTVFVPDLVLRGHDGAELPHRRHPRDAPARDDAAVSGRPLTSEPMEFDGLARIIEFRAAEAPQLL